jgi:hypothetical protein
MTTQINTTFARPLTSQLTQAQIELVAFYSPAKAIKYLVLAWLALSSASSSASSSADRATVIKHIAYAHVRLDCAITALADFAP